MLERVECGHHDVQNVGRAHGLGQNIADSGHLQHCPDAAGGDHARSGRGRLEEDARTTHGAQRFMRNGGAGQIHDLHLLAGALRGLAHGIRHGIGLAGAHSDGALPIADHNSHAEAKAPAALHDLGHARDLDHALLEGILRFELLLLPTHSILVNHVGLRLA